MGLLLRAVAIVNWVARMHSNYRERERERENCLREFCVLRETGTRYEHLQTVVVESFVFYERKTSSCISTCILATWRRNIFCVDIQTDESIKFLLTPKQGLNGGDYT